MNVGFLALLPNEIRVVKRRKIHPHVELLGVDGWHQIQLNIRTLTVMFGKVLANPLEAFARSWLRLWRFWRWYLWLAHTFGLKAASTNNRIPLSLSARIVLHRM